jgi:hypothetical protein
MFNMPSFSRLKLILLAALANGVTFLSAIIFKWSLVEVAIVYWGEFLSIALITLVIISRAKTINDAITFGNVTRFQVIKRKTITFMVAFLMYGLFLGGFFLFLYYVAHGSELPMHTLIAISFCVALFFIAQIFSYIKESKSGIYVELISDARISTPFWRVLPMYIMLPLLAMKEQGVNYSFGQFVLALAAIAVIDISMYVVHLDQCNRRSQELT